MHGKANVQKVDGPHCQADQPVRYKEGRAGSNSPPADTRMAASRRGHMSMPLARAMWARPRRRSRRYGAPRRAKSCVSEEEDARSPVSHVPSARLPLLARVSLHSLWVYEVHKVDG